MPSRTHLGDSHNFGRRVTMGARVVNKPRTIFWEWLVLGADSPLRQVLREAAETDGLGTEAFEFLPGLTFSSSRAQEGGVVERIRLEPLPRLSAVKRGALAEIVGRAIALFSWLGVADLHWENLVVGVAARGRMIFAPLDVEMILADLSLPTETKLLPDADPEYAAVCRHACGVRRVLPYLGKPVGAGDLLALAGSYRRTLALLDRHARAIAGVLAGLPELRRAPIRVCLRGTGEYVRARSAPVWPPLLSEEEEQLARGDIPYFFRLYGQRGIRYYADAGLGEVGTLPHEGDVPQLDPLLQISRGLRAPSRTRLREEGLLSVIGAFDHPSLAGRHETDDLEVTFKPRSLVVRLRPDGDELESKRDLSAFVGSVYLRCRCGEVRTVFVPPRTVCDAPP